MERVQTLALIAAQLYTTDCVKDTNRMGVSRSKANDPKDYVAEAAELLKYAKDYLNNPPFGNNRQAERLTLER